MLGSDMDPGLRFATPTLTQRQQPIRVRKAMFNFSIGVRETIRHLFIVRSGRQPQLFQHLKIKNLQEDLDLEMFNSKD